MCHLWNWHFLFLSVSFIDPYMYSSINMKLPNFFQIYFKHLGFIVEKYRLLWIEPTHSQHWAVALSLSKLKIFAFQFCFLQKLIHLDVGRYAYIVYRVETRSTRMDLIDSNWALSCDLFLVSCQSPWEIENSLCDNRRTHNQLNKNTGQTPYTLKTV